ncbi:hypothetical protein HMPREF1221_00073 [Treponema socranskii subsp. paredis ATCC 35535]|nr:hypothetical protein HMPREF1221_00073 [Treponema socranskii subsp. paredis ATCC 35535]
MKKNNNNRRAASVFGGYIKKHWHLILLIAAGYIAVSAVNFLNIATSQTIASFSLDDFELGQIADRDIIAPRDIGATYDNPLTVQKGERIIRKGFAIERENYDKLRKLAESPAYFDYRKFFNNELFLLVLGVVWFLLFAFLPFGRKIFLNEWVLQVVFFLFVYAAAAFGRKTGTFSSPYMLPVIIPSAFCTLLVSILYGQLSSVLFCAVAAFGVYNAADWALIPFLFTILSCFAATNIVRRIERRIDMVVASLLLALVNIVCMIVLIVIDNESFQRMPVALAGAAFNGFISGILALGFLTPLELLLNTASVFRLMDLSDLNNPTMRRLMLSASGTYTHSLMVAQLAESACREIGANSLVARVGAYYHDIGKMDQSEYFVENQTGTNKHDDINPSLSVAVIKSHVKRGVEKAHQMHLPRQVIDIIAEHHGNSVISYFYNAAKEKDPSVSPEEFRYTGTPPTSRESAVVMLADTVEAACRTLENPSASRLDKFIQMLFNAKVEHGQLDNCDLTFRDMAKIKGAFVQLLAGYYHNRIEYPNQKNPDEDRKENKASDKKTDDKTGDKKDEKKQGDKKSDAGKSNG